VTGDFKSKLGQRTEEDHDIMGKHVHTKARRNTHGQYLCNYLRESKLIAANTLFQHKDHEIAIWHGKIQKAGFDRPYRIHNKIDFIAVQRRVTKLLTDARAYQGTSGLQYESDHALVVITVHIPKLYKKRKERYEWKNKRDVFQLYADQPVREQFAEQVTTNVQNYIINGGMDSEPQVIYD